MLNEAQMDKNISEVIKEVWMDTLNVNEISGDDSFFDLKGNSLQALVMIEILKNRLNIELFIQDVFENETLKAFVQCIEKKSNPLIMQS